jgi:polysaccharide biosynthesis protein PslH
MPKLASAPPSDDLFMTAHNGAARPRVLFFAPVLEYPPASGGQISVVNAVRVLNQISELHIVTTVPLTHPGAAETVRFFKAHCHALLQAPSAALNPASRTLAMLLRRSRRLASRVFAAADGRFMLRYADAHGIDIFWVDRVLEHAFSVFRHLRRARPRARIVADTCAVYSRFVLRELPLETRPLRRLWISLRGRKKEDEERILTRTADVLTAVSELDARYFRSIAPQSERVKLFSNVIDVDQYVSARDRSRSSSILLIGQFGHVNSPMDRAASWLVDEVMPLVLSQVPEAHLHIVGRNADKTQGHRRCDSISVVGHVPSVLPYLEQARATVVPLRFESGTRFKILESGAAAVPCISTALGAEGINVTHDQNVLIAETAQEFAAAIVRVLRDPEYARSLGEGLLELVSEHYSLKTQAREGRAILDFIGGARIAES